LHGIGGEDFRCLRRDVDAHLGHRLDGSGFELSVGTLRAERTSIASPARRDRKPAAICERPALYTQTNNSLGVVDMN